MTIWRYKNGTGGQLPGGYWHWQNLDEDRNGREKGRGWKHGRAWFNFRTDRETGQDDNSIQSHVEWVARLRLDSPVSMRLAFGEGDSGKEIAGHLGIFGTTLYWGLDAPLIRRLCSRILGNRYDSGREISFRINDRAVWWHVWHNDDTWSSKDSKWRRGSFHVDEWVLGKNVYASETVEYRDPAIIPMPEGPYRAVARLNLDTWTRSRLGWPQRRLYRVQVDIPGGIPTPGKGENSWDCEDDATFGITTPADSIEKGIANLVESVLTRRRRYGGVNWNPPISLAKVTA